jgi:methylglutaconyl-CoA hydratase
MECFVKTDLQNGVGRITLDRPEKRNALTREFIEQLIAAVIQLRSDENLRVLVLEATGSVFCAGMDLGEMQARAASADREQEWQRDSEVYCQLLSQIFGLEVPTVAVLSGPVFAGGVGLVLACDFLLASEEVFFMLPEPMRGISAAIVTPLLIHRLGPGPASQMLLSGEITSAPRGLQTGLCHDVVPLAELDDRAERLIKSILAGSKSALRITKKHLADCCGNDVLDQLKDSIRISATARETEDAREGLAAFLEKRKPSW